MKLNRTYSLLEMLSALTAASANSCDVAKAMQTEGVTSSSFIVFEAENMLSTSPHARVTLTRKVSADRWEGYMETGAYHGMERTPVAVNRCEYVLKANADFTCFELIM